MALTATHVSARDIVGVTTDINHWLDVVRAEYLEMPGLQLTKPQAQRLWGLDQSTCDVVLNALARAGFLRLTARNVFVRVDMGF